MDVRLSPEQRALRDSVAHVVDRHGIRAVRDLDDAERRSKLDAAIHASGWRELRTPTEAGEPWSSAVEVAIVAEELASGLADAPYLGPTLAVELRRLMGVPATTSNETVALSADLGALTDPAIAIDAAGASTALVIVDGDRLAEVALEAISIGVDLTRPTATIIASGLRPVDSSALADDDLARWTAFGLAITSADLIGVMRGAVRLARDYAVERKQYGAAIGSFQAVQHLLADAFVATEGSRSAALHAAWAVDALSPEDALAASAVAKAYCARAARTVCEIAIQVHGGIGNTWECLAHVYLRRALLSSDVLGGAGPNLARVLAHHGVIDDGGAGDGLR
jgi:alkylation response protein AidB-like acyl-CoA dehydrogenase